jgi:hypothetical protein
MLIMTGATFISRLPSRSAAATPEGLAVLESNSELQDVVAQFAEDGLRTPFVGYPKLGAGIHGEVRDVAGLAVKVGGPATNGNNPWWLPGSLHHQFVFMNAMTQHLQGRPEHNVHVPEQYFTLLSRQGSALHVQQRVPEAQTLSDWMIDNRILDYYNRDAVRRQVRSRISGAMGHSALRHGLDDLNLDPAHFATPTNVMVWEGADFADLPESPLYVIDQPCGTLRGWLGMWAAQRAVESSTELIQFSN